MVKIGIFGGSFNPPHRGHIFLAQYAKKVCELEKVIFVPTGKHAFDSKGGMTSAVHRIRMVELAAHGNPGFEISDIEVRNPEKSYTYNTLRALKEETGGDAGLCFITGTDEILEIDRWYEWENLLREFEFIIAARPGVDLAEAEAKIKEYGEKYGARITLLRDIPAPDISSTQVRAFIDDTRKKLEIGGASGATQTGGTTGTSGATGATGATQTGATVATSAEPRTKFDFDNLPIEPEVLEYILENNLYRENRI